MRRTLISIVAGLALLLPSVATTAGEETPAIPSPVLAPKIRALVAPLATVPSIVAAGTTLSIELDAQSVADPSGATATLIPSFGQARPEIPLTVTSATSSVPSVLWHGERTVHLLTANVPAIGGVVVEDLYDLHVAWNGGSDRQRRAVKIVSAYPAKPRFVVIADPSVGDPRAIQEGVEDLQATRDPHPLLENTNATIGDPPFENRWKAFLKTIEEVNLIRPDFVLVAGDLNFGVYPEALNYEYEESYRLIDTIEVPTFLSPGNHDLYHFDYDRSGRPSTTDGKKLWSLYYGPTYWSVNAGPDLHIVSLNTYDWPDDDRPPFVLSDGSTRSGGNIRDEQFAWIESDLRSYRAANPNGSIVTFAHHDPSWMGRRHPWPGAKRLELRDLLAEVNAGVHFAGHTHDDRVARYHQGNVVETNGNNSFPKKQLHYILRNDTLDASWSQDALAAIVRDPSHGPLFVNTTTAASGLKGPDWGLGSYWGWRYGVLDRKNGGFDPNDFGYPATEEFLNATARRPQNYNAAHAPLGVFSYPSFHLDVARSSEAGNGPVRESVTLTSRLLAGVTPVVRLSVAVASIDAMTITGGTVLQSRSFGGVTDVWVQVALPAGATRTVAAAA